MTKISSSRLPAMALGVSLVATEDARGMRKIRCRWLPSLALIPLVGITLGCNQDDQRSAAPDSAKPRVEAVQSAQPPTHEELANAMFGGVADEPVQLVDGRWQGRPFVEDGASRPTVGLVDDFLLTGDLDGDGSEESVVLLWTSSGGSGTFDYIAATARGGNGIVNFGTAALGDRVQVRAGRIYEGNIELDVIQAGPDDAACCPSQMATRVWNFTSRALSEIASKITGTMSLAELYGPEWVMTRLSSDEPAPAGPEVTLSFEEDRIAGKAGCNGYFGTVREDGEMPGNISIGQIGSTRMMCTAEIMQVEDRFLRQVGEVVRYGFFAGKLALSWQSGDSSGVMLFAPREPAISDS